MKKEIAEKILNQNRAIYDKVATDFSATRDKLWPEFEYFKGYLQNGQDILDLGCGNGRLLELLASYKIKYLGVDYSSQLLESAKNNWPKFNFQNIDLLDLNLPDKYDLVFLVSVLQYVPSQKLREKVLLNIKSVLKPDGKLLMINWNLWQPRYLKYIIKYTLLKLAEPNKMIIDNVKAKDLDFQDIFMQFFKKTNLRYMHAFTEHNLTKLLKKTGFEIIKNVSNKRNIITIARLTQPK